MNKNVEKSTGTVKFFNGTKGFGFIIVDGQENELFFHATNIIGEKPTENEHVEFEISTGKRGDFAMNVVKV